MLQEAFAAAQNTLIDQMYGVKLDDKDGHTRLIMALQISKAVHRYLWSLIQDGQVADEQLRMRGRRID